MLNGVSLLVNSCFKDRIGRGFYIALWPTTNDGYITIIPSAENHGECPDMPPRWRPDRIFTMLRLCSAFGGTSSVWCIISCWNRMELSQGIGIEHNWCVWAEYQKKHDKDIFEHDYARPRVARPAKAYLETLKWEVLSHPPYSPNVAPSNYHLFRSMAQGLAYQRFRSHEEVKKISIRGSPHIWFLLAEGLPSFFSQIIKVFTVQYIMKLLHCKSHITAMRLWMCALCS